MNPISPKVWAQVAVTVVLGSLVAGLGAVTPGMLAFLGPWAPVAFAAVTAAGAGVAGYVVTDPVRAAGSASLAVHASIAAAAPVDLPPVTIAPPAPVAPPVVNLVVPAPVAKPEPPVDDVPPGVQPIS